ncbi:MAG: hypothetical protein FJX35_21525 [Alphaproteobacteria bacterium]|nr:hypothetical protein [Alphaproteobacteria bacterium]
MAASNFTFTAGADNFTDNAGDTLTAVATAANFTNGDGPVDAGDQNDTLRFDGGGTFNFSNTITNFETILLNNDAAYTFSLSNPNIGSGQTLAINGAALTTGT